KRNRRNVSRRSARNLTLDKTKEASGGRNLNSRDTLAQRKLTSVESFPGTAKRSDGERVSHRLSVAALSTGAWLLSGDRGLNGSSHLRISSTRERCRQR